METLGDRIRKLRESLGLNQAEFAIRIGLGGPTVISKYEKNQVEPNVGTLKKIAELGNIALDWLLTGSGEMYREKKEVMFQKDVDPELLDIIEMLKEYPQDKKLVLKLLKGKKDIKEALEGFGLKNLLTEGL